MKIAVVTPLFPPDVASPAPYTKELARRLAETDSVEVLTYGTLPEEVHGATIHTVSKRLAVPVRLALFTFQLWSAARRNELIIIERGPSVELPAALVVSVLPRTYLLHNDDVRARNRVESSAFLKLIQKLVLRRASTLQSSPLPRPEILPFSTYPAQDFETYETSWKNHLHDLKNLAYA